MAGLLLNSLPHVGHENGPRFPMKIVNLKEDISLGGGGIIITPSLGPPSLKVTVRHIYKGKLIQTNI